MKDYLKHGGKRRRSHDGGKTLLYEGSYPETLYHWTQARFEWEAALAKVRGKISPKILSSLSDAADRLDRHLVGPILLGPGTQVGGSRRAARPRRTGEPPNRLPRRPVAADALGPVPTVSV